MLLCWGGPGKLGQGYVGIIYLCWTLDIDRLVGRGHQCWIADSLDNERSLHFFTSWRLGVKAAVDHPYPPAPTILSGITYSLWVTQSGYPINVSMIQKPRSSPFSLAMRRPVQGISVRVAAFLQSQGMSQPAQLPCHHRMKQLRLPHLFQHRSIRDMIRPFDTEHVSVTTRSEGIDTCFHHARYGPCLASI